MKNRIKGTKLLSILILLTLFLNLGCSEQLIESEGNITGEKKTITLSLNAPGMSNTSTRAIPNEAILTDIQILVFEELSDGSEVYRYTARITPKTEVTYTIEAKISKSNEKYRFVVLANAPQISLSDGDIGKKKEDVLKRFSFDCAGIWNATESPSRPFPMWGEYKNTITIKKEEYLDILLHRALAKVDVGLNFNPQTQENQTEVVEGIKNKEGKEIFKLTSVRVYRTKNKGYMASSAEKINSNNEVILPNIPSDAMYNLGDETSSNNLEEADKKPLVYKFTPRNSYVREVYIPESIESVDGKTMDEVPCLVIGGYYGVDNTSDETFYRVDFAEYEANGTVKKNSYKTILRNHRYVVNIKSVSGSGFKEPEEALNSINVKLGLEVIGWNEVPLDYFVHGDYYFKINTRNVVLPAEGRVEAPYDGFSIFYLDYETNLEVDESSFIKKWESSGTAQSDYGFNVFFDKDFATGLVKLIVGNLSNIPNEDEGITGEERSDVVEFTVDNKFTFTIRIKQEEYRNLNYELICESKVVNGVYLKGRGLTSNAYIDINIKADEGTGTLVGSSYLIETDKVNGISFKAEGKFGERSESLDKKGTSYRIRLQGIGVPTKYTESTYQITCNSISEGNTTCSVDIATAYKPIKILAISSNSNYGYGLNPGRYANSLNFVLSPANFGTTLNSKVKVENISIDHTTSSRTFGNKLKDNPDIVLIGHPGSYVNSANEEALYEYVKKGGVLIALHESNFSGFIKRLHGFNSSSTNNLSGSNRSYRMEISTTIDDRITNGPFGALMGKYWGVDVYSYNDYVTKYSTSNIINYSPIGEGSIMFRHTDFNFFYCGDGGFLSNAAANGLSISTTDQPFAIDRLNNYTPIVKSYSGGDIYNSYLFGNIMTWAIHQATYHGINK